MLAILARRTQNLKGLPGERRMKVWAKKTRKGGGAPSEGRIVLLHFYAMHMDHNENP